MVQIPAGKVIVGDTPERLKQWWSQVPGLAQNPAEMDRILNDWTEAKERTEMLASFWIDRYEVSNDEYATFVAATGHAPPKHWNGQSRPVPGEKELPVTNVSYSDAVAYAAWAGKSLPTVAQWVRAFRADKTQPYPWGNAAEPTRANVKENPAFPKTCPITATPRDVSPFQVFNLAGNVSEITRDRQVNRGADMVVLKGADFHELGGVCGVASYRSFLPNSAVFSPLVGFRCVVEEPAAGENAGRQP
jgi:formylglycine-generating enzyme required for sulfatase activity